MDLHGHHPVVFVRIWLLDEEGCCTDVDEAPPTHTRAGPDRHRVPHSQQDPLVSRTRVGNTMGTSLRVCRCGHLSHDRLGTQRCHSTCGIITHINCRWVPPAALTLDRGRRFVFSTHPWWDGNGQGVTSSPPPVSTPSALAHRVNYRRCSHPPRCIL